MQKSVWCLISAFASCLSIQANAMIVLGAHSNSAAQSSSLICSVDGFNDGSLPQIWGADYCEAYASRACADFCLSAERSAYNDGMHDGNNECCGSVSDEINNAARDYVQNLLDNKHQKWIEQDQNKIRNSSLNTTDKDRLIQNLANHQADDPLLSSEIDHSFSTMNCQVNRRGRPGDDSSGIRGGRFSNGGLLLIPCSKAVWDAFRYSCILWSTIGIRFYEQNLKDLCMGECSTAAAYDQGFAKGKNSCCVRQKSTLLANINKLKESKLRSLQFKHGQFLNNQLSKVNNDTSDELAQWASLYNNITESDNDTAIPFINRFACSNATRSIEGGTAPLGFAIFLSIVMRELLL